MSVCRDLRRHGLQHGHFREVLSVASGVKGEKTVGLDKSVRTDQKVRQQTFRGFPGRFASAIRICGESSSALNPYPLFQPIVYGDSSSFEKTVQEAFACARVSMQLRKDRRGEKQRSFELGRTQLRYQSRRRGLARPDGRENIRVNRGSHRSPSPRRSSIQALISSRVEKAGRMPK